MSKVLVLSDLPTGDSIAALGWCERADMFGRELLSMHDAGLLRGFIVERASGVQAVLAGARRRGAGSPDVLRIAPDASAANLLDNLTKDGLTKVFDAPVRALSAEDLQCHDRSRNFDNLDAVFILEASGDADVLSAVFGAGLVAATVIADYRDGAIGAYEAMPEAA